MTRRGHFRLTQAGFILLYVAAVGSLITLAVPFLDGMREETLAFVMLPAGILGVVLSGIAQRVPIDPDTFD